MIESLIAGRVHQQAKQKTDRNGKPYTTLRLKVPHGENSLLIGVICYEPAPCRPKATRHNSARLRHP